ncbi:DUF805 domain-containing protein [Ignatzschineria sp. LJL83]
MLKWYLKAIKNYANFSGRACRREFWYFFLVNLLIFIAVMSVILITGPLTTSPNVWGEPEMSAMGNFVMGIVSFGYLIYLAILYIPTISISVRRLHDADKSGLWYFVTFIPGIGFFIFLLMMSLAGTYGRNRFGSDPRLNN